MDSGARSQIFVLSPVHTGDYSRQNRRLSSNSATVAKTGDCRNSATIVASVDRALAMLTWPFIPLSVSGA